MAGFASSTRGARDLGPVLHPGRGKRYTTHRQDQRCGARRGRGEVGAGRCTHSLTHPLTHLLTHSLTHSRTLVQVLSFPERHKRPWLNVFLRYGLAPKHAKAFVLGIKGGFPELAAKLRRLIPPERVESVLEEVRGVRVSVCAEKCPLYDCACACMSRCASVCLLSRPRAR